MNDKQLWSAKVIVWMVLLTAMVFVARFIQLGIAKCIGE